MLHLENSPSKTHPIGEGLRVLVVEDEPAFQRFLRVILEREGFAVEIYDNLESAVQRCQTHDFDILITDKKLPDGSGLFLCRQLVEAKADCELVIVSGYANVASAVEAIHLGVTDYIVKPFDGNELVARVTRVVERQQLKRGNKRLIEELKRKNEQLARLAVRDPLTQLFNYGYLQEALESEVVRSRRHNHTFSLALIDIDRFREINDTLGHVVGDEVLKKVGHFLQNGSRQSDMPFHLGGHEITARYGADIFAMILPETPKGGAATKLNCLLNKIQEIDFCIEGLPKQTLSIGLATYPQDGKDREDLIKAADVALAAVKRAGGGQVVGYSKLLSSCSRASAAETQKMQTLGRSLANNLFSFVYQPIVNIEDWTLLGYEALCRPTDKGFSHVLDLLDTAIRAGRIYDLSRTLRRLAVEPISQLPESILLFINLHSQDLNDPFLLELESYIRPWTSRIVFEVTETQAINDYEQARTQIKRLRDHGFRVALDDLGSGYSGLNSLALLEPDFVKIDRELIRDIQPNNRTGRLVKHIIEFCEDENLVAIAEGVETRNEYDVVAQLGARYMQGYLIAKPSPPFCQIPERIDPECSK